MRKQIPNSITLINVFFGCCALVQVFYGNVNWVIIFLILAGLADFADGLVARALQVHSPLGKELDSLADMVSFGVVPGAMLFAILGGVSNADFPNYLPFVGFVLTMFAAFRLAKFNLDERQTDDFIGLATPSATMFTTGLYVIYFKNALGLAWLVGNPMFLIPVILLFSFLLVSEIRMFSFKFKKFQWKGNEFRFALMLVAILLLIILKEASFSFIILTYIIFALIENNLFQKSKA